MKETTTSNHIECHDCGFFGSGDALTEACPACDAPRVPELSRGPRNGEVHYGTDIPLYRCNDCGATADGNHLRPNDRCPCGGSWQKVE